MCGQAATSSPSCGGCSGEGLTAGVHVCSELTVRREGGMLRREHSPPHDKCHWIPQKVLSIPARAAFTSYAGLAIRGKYLLVASKVALLCSCWMPCRRHQAAEVHARGKHEMGLEDAVSVPSTGSQAQTHGCIL